MLSDVRGVIFDIGETLRDDTRAFGLWADWCGVPRHTFSALIGAIRALGGRTDDVFSYIGKSGLDLAQERSRMLEAGFDEPMEEQDLYPDVRNALEILTGAGYWCCAAGNQTARCGELLERMRLPLKVVLTSESIGYSKPDRRYFEAVIRATPFGPSELLHVGDNVKSDVTGAAALGLRSVLVRRGPWGHLDFETDEAAKANMRVDDLMGLVRALVPRRVILQPWGPR